MTCNVDYPLLVGRRFFPRPRDSSLNKKYALIDSIVQPKHTKLFLEGLNDQASLQLLSYHAFMGNIAKKGYEEVDLLETIKRRYKAPYEMGQALGRGLAIFKEMEEVTSRLEEKIDGLKDKLDKMDSDYLEFCKERHDEEKESFFETMMKRTEAMYKDQIKKIAKDTEEIKAEIEEREEDLEMLRVVVKYLEAEVKAKGLFVKHGISDSSKAMRVLMVSANGAAETLTLAPDFVKGGRAMKSLFDLLD
ncbi:hypothetical protein OSB04_013425 [Centaurea solstitialis]|uniref:Uncharacterized protein n=1 Tax=Centaurea solstitialis TaxID=347529 RepID=A0AA38TR63_9ASTR|nr:hypothetical protein OSB04_013425 [Centaurea solstitialis]